MGRWKLSIAMLMLERLRGSVLVHICSVMGAIAIADARREAVVVGEAELEPDKAGTVGDCVDEMR